MWYFYYIHKRGRVREGRAPPVTARGSFLHLHLFSMKMNILLTVMSPQNNLILITTYTNGITIISKPEKELTNRSLRG